MNDQVTIIEDRPSPLLVPLRGHADQWAWLDPETRRLSPVIRGGFDAPIQHPLGPPVVTNTSISIDMMLKEPTRITGFLMDITLQKFIADLLFASGGGVTGGAVVFDIVAENEIYLGRDVQRIMPGGDYPLVTSSRRAPGVAEVEKWGGKYYFTDEAKDRNDQVLFTNRNTQLANTIVRKNNQRAVAIAAAAIASLGDASFPGNDWSAAIPNGSDPTAPAETPAADIATAQLLAEQRELGIDFNTLILSPYNKFLLSLFYGKDLSQMLRDNGIGTLFSTNRMAEGKAWLVAKQQVGEMRVEAPLSTEATRDQGEHSNDRTWIKSGVRNVMFANNPYAIVEVTGVGTSS